MVNIGNYMFLAHFQIQALLDCTSPKVRKIVEEARKDPRVYDCTKKGEPQTAIITVNNCIYLSEMTIRTIRSRLNKNKAEENEDED